MTRLARQSFLGTDSDRILRGATVGLVGLGGGGSHIGQQFAHAGVGGYVLVDPQEIDETNTNRLIGGTLTDVRDGTLKTVITARLIRGLMPDARIQEYNTSWHDATDALKACDLIMGCLDTFSEREQLERFARRYLIPYIDIGMDVHETSKGRFLVAGQIVRSCPGEPCLRCCGIVTDERLRREAEAYGAAGGRPQVVWPNGVLASTAVGLAIQMLTPWFQPERGFSYLEYDGNRSTVRESARMQHLKGRTCPHHPPTDTGDPWFDLREFMKPHAPVHLDKTPWPISVLEFIRGQFRRCTAIFTRRG